MGIVYDKVSKFLKRYPMTVAWRVKAHCKVAESYINDDEEVLYAFAAQKGVSSVDMFNTFVIVITDKRIILAQKRVLFGYIYYAITPDMFNDLTIRMGFIWGKVIIDTVKELVVLTFIPKGALRELETVFSKYMMDKKHNVSLDGVIRSYDDSSLNSSSSGSVDDEIKRISRDGGN